MTNTLCNFTSIDGLLAKADMGQLNITTVISSCPDLCSLAWGTGNPDLSGIGTNISYIIQAILTFIFGPLFCFAYFYRKKFTEDTNRMLEDLQDTFLDFSAPFSITVAIAAVIRFHQHPPFYELAFLRSLTTVQFLSLLSTAVTAGIFEKRKSAVRIAGIVVYGILEFGFYVGLIGSLRASKASWETLTELSEACKAYSHILPWSAYIPVRRWENKAQKVAIIIGFTLAGVLGLGIAVGILQLMTYILASREVRLVGPISLAFAIAMLVEVVQMERTRNTMKEVTGAEFQDNQWGFGQVIAFLLWAPLGVQMFYYGILIALHAADPQLIEDIMPLSMTEETPIDAETKTPVDRSTTRISTGAGRYRNTRAARLLIILETVRATCQGHIHSTF